MFHKSLNSYDSPGRLSKHILNVFVGYLKDFREKPILFAFVCSECRLVLVDVRNKSPTYTFILLSKEKVFRDGTGL